MEEWKESTEKAGRALGRRGTNPPRCVGSRFMG